MTSDAVFKAVRGALLVGLLIYFLVSLGCALIADRRAKGYGELKRGHGQEPLMRVLLMNRRELLDERAPPVPSRTFDQVPVVALQDVDVFAPESANPDHRLALKSGTRLMIQPSADGMTLSISDGSGGRQLQWNVSVVRAQPATTDPGMLIEPGAARVGDVAFEAADHDAVFAIGKGRFRGSLEIIFGTVKEVTAVNVLPMEAYIEGVIAAEMSSAYPLEALKAQAIASRSYAYVRAKTSRDAARRWDLLDTADDQEYRGHGHGNAITRRAVIETRGVLLSIHGQAFAPLFCASSGGTTASIEQVLPGARDASGRWALGDLAMYPRRDPYCEPGAAGLGRTERYWRSTAVIRPRDIQRELVKLMEPSGRPVGYTKNVRIGRHDARSNRVETVIIDHTLGDPIEISAHTFRMILGPGLIRSTMWIDDSPKRMPNAENAKLVDYQIICQGYGHGVGMSQVSAWEMARRGMSSKSILEFFYGTTVAPVAVW